MAILISLKINIWVDHSLKVIKPVVTDFSSSSCEVWPTSVFSPVSFS